MTKFLRAILIAVAALASSSFVAHAQYPSPIFNGLQVTGETFTGASSPNAAGLNIMPGSAPTLPNNGDVWIVGQSLYWQGGGITNQALGTGALSTPPPIGDVTPNQIGATSLTATSLVVGTPTGGAQGPGSGNFVSLFVNGVSVTGSSGAVTSSPAGQVAWYSVTGSTIVGNPNLTISGAALSIGGPAVGASITLYGSTSGSTQLVGAAVAGSSVLTFPSGTDTVDTLLSVATLQNKTMSGANNTFSAIPLSALASQSANILVGTTASGSPSAQAVPSCSGAANALIWTTGTGLGCNTITVGSAASIGVGSTSVNSSTVGDLLTVGASNLLGEATVASLTIATSQLSGIVALANLPTGTNSSSVPIGGVITAAGPIGSGSVIPVITYNAAGQLTTVGTATPAASGLAGTTLASNVVTSSLTTVGVLGAGTWQATIINPTYGGTGVNNGAKTITLGGSLTTTGAATPTLAFGTGSNTYTFPAASATLATTAGIAAAIPSASSSQIYVGTGAAGALAVVSTLPTAALPNLTAASVVNWDANTSVQAATEVILESWPWATGTIKSVSYHTGGTGTPSYVIGVQINGTGVTSCSAITVNSATTASTTCGSNTVTLGQKVTFTTSSISGVPFSSAAQVTFSHSGS